jgi:hypothetical protein
MYIYTFIYAYIYIYIYILYNIGLTPFPKVLALDFNLSLCLNDWNDTLAGNQQAVHSDNTPLSPSIPNCSLTSSYPIYSSPSQLNTHHYPINKTNTLTPRTQNLSRNTSISSHELNNGKEASLLLGKLRSIGTLHIYIIYIHVCVYIYIYIYTYM